MYTYYTALSTWTMADFLSDIHALCTGSDIASLSASCNKPASHQNGTTVSAGWTSYDTATAQTTVPGYVISASDVDGLTTKYFNFWGSSSTVVSFRMVEAWDAGANTATNAGQTSTFTLTAATAFSMHIFCTPQYIIMYHTTSGVIGWLCLEVLRDSPPLYNAATIPLVGGVAPTSFFTSVSGNLYLPRLKSPVTGTTLTTSSAVLSGMSIAPRYVNAPTGTMTSASAGAQYASDGTQYVPVTPLYLGYPQGTVGLNATYLGRVAGTNGLYPRLITAALTGASGGDDITIEGATYKLLSLSQGFVVPIQ